MNGSDCLNIRDYQIALKDAAVRQVVPKRGIGLPALTGCFFF
jgi:hypothetical protein